MLCYIPTYKILASYALVYVFAHLGICVCIRAPTVNILEVNNPWKSFSSHSVIPQLCMDIRPGKT
jgi:hypothetical protein